MATDLIKMLKKLYGLPPYDGWTNHCYGDPILTKSIHDHYTQAEINQAKRQLGLYIPSNIS